MTTCWWPGPRRWWAMSLWLDMIECFWRPLAMLIVMTAAWACAARERPVRRGPTDDHGAPVLTCVVVHRDRAGGMAHGALRRLAAGLRRRAAWLRSDPSAQAMRDYLVTAVIAVEGVFLAWLLCVCA